MLTDVILIILIIAIPLIADLKIKSAYKKNLEIKNASGLSGQEVARKILDRHGLTSVYVVETTGYLSDHYDPKRKVVRLSNEVFNGESVASMAIAAHECGHAIQDKENYFFLKLRSFIYPIVNIGTNISYFIIVIGFVLGLLNLVLIGIALSFIGLIFQVITLPVEFNASSRAKKELDNIGIVNREEASGVSNVLTAAALTYVAGVLATILQIIRLFLANRRD